MPGLSTRVLTTHAIAHPAQEISETIVERVAFLKKNGCSELVIESVLKNVDPY